MKKRTQISATASKTLLKIMERRAEVAPQLGLNSKEEI